MVKLNINTVLLVLGGLGVFAPDIEAVALGLATWHIAWLAPVVKVLGYTATVFGSVALAVPKLRAFLSLFKLATPAGTMVPHLDDKPQATSQKEVAPLLPKDAGFVLPSRAFFLLAVSLLMIFLMLFFLRKARGEEIVVPSPPTPTTITAPATVQTQPATAAPVAKAAPVSEPVAEGKPAPAAASPGTARKPYVDSKYGGCKGDFCLAPALAIQAFQYVPSTGDMTGGVAFSGGYGVVWHTLVDIGFAGYGGIQYSRDKPFTAQLVGMFSIANYVAFGPGFLMLGQPSGPAKTHLIVCFAANWIPGLVPSN